MGRRIILQFKDASSCWFFVLFLQMGMYLEYLLTTARLVRFTGREYLGALRSDNCFSSMLLSRALQVRLGGVRVRCTVRQYTWALYYNDDFSESRFYSDYQALDYHKLIKTWYYTITLKIILCHRWMLLLQRIPKRNKVVTSQFHLVSISRTHSRVLAHLCHHAPSEREKMPPKSDPKSCKQTPISADAIPPDRSPEESHVEMCIIIIRAEEPRGGELANSSHIRCWPVVLAAVEFIDRVQGQQPVSLAMASETGFWGDAATASAVATPARLMCGCEKSTWVCEQTSEKQGGGSYD